MSPFMSPDVARALGKAFEEWHTKKRRMGCVSATRWFCERVPGFRPLRLTLYASNGDEYQHVVATNDSVHVDLAPHARKPRKS